VIFKVFMKLQNIPLNLKVLKLIENRSFVIELQYNLLYIIHFGYCQTFILMSTHY